jgi:flagellar motor switch protein FliM
MSATGAEAGGRRAKLYDFRRPDKFSKEQIRTMQIIHETFARLSTTTLSTVQRCMAEVRVVLVDQLTYGEFFESRHGPTTLSILAMDPLKGQALLEMDQILAFQIFQGLLGGSDSPESPPIDRELSDIELAILEKLLIRLQGNLKTAWSQVLDLQPHLAAIETHPQFAQIVPPSEMIILVSLEAKIGNAEGMINLVFPYITIEPIVPKLSAQYWYSSLRKGGETDPALVDRLQGLDLPVEVLVEGERLSLRELGALKKGSLVRLPGLERGEAFLRMGGETVFKMKASPRRGGRSPAYEILDKPKAEAFPEPERAKGDEAESETAALKAALEEFRSGFGGSLAAIAGGVAELRKRQDLLSDQLTLGKPAVVDWDGADSETAGKRPFDFVGRADPGQVLSLLSSEHPQTIALVLSHLEPQVASGILGRLAPELQADIALRIARMGKIAPELLREVDRVLCKRLSAADSDSYAAAGGVDSVAGLLNLADRSTERRIVEALEIADPALAGEIKKRMFVFEDILLLDRGAIERLARRLDPGLFACAMKTVAEGERDSLLESLPAAEAREVKARYEALGRLRLSEVDAAQQKVLAIVREMEESGEIVLPRSS